MANVGTRLLKLTVDAVDYTAVCSKAEIDSAASSSDFVSFAAAAAGGGRDYVIDIVAAQDLAAATLWDLTYSHAGETVDFVMAPYGNIDAPTAAQPIFTGSLVITEPDGQWIGGEANSSTTAVQTFEVQWALTGKPTRVTTGS